MELGEMMRLTKDAGDPEYLDAERLHKNVVLESEMLAKLLQAAQSRKWDFYNRMEDAAESYYEKLEDEISVAPACKCECKGS
jgi:hypothetical protein